MPPKKKKAGKKSSKKDEKAEGDEGGDSGIPDELDKDKVLDDIKDWERRLVRYQEKRRQLEVVNSELLERYEDGNKSRQDSIAFLKKTMEQRDDEISELQDRLTGLRQLKEQKKEEAEQRLQRMRTDFQEMKDQLTSENNLAATKLASLEEFKREKENIEARYRALQDEYQKLLDDHEAAKQRIEEKNLLDRDRLKKDMVTRVNQVAAEFRKVSNKQMADTTKRTIRENVSIQSQLNKMQDKRLELEQDNEQLRLRLRQQRRQIQELERTQKEIATKHACHTRIIDMLRHKRRELDVMVDEFRRREKEIERMEADSERLRDQVEEQREEVESLAALLEQQETSLASADEKLSGTQEENSRARACIGAAAESLKSALQLPVGEADGERLLTQLRQLLADAVTDLPAPAVSRPVTAATQQTDEDVELNDELLHGAAGDRSAEKSGSSLPPIGVAGHCQPGALQLVPSPNRKIPTFKDRTAGAAAKRLDVGADLPPAAVRALAARRFEEKARRSGTATSASVVHLL